MPQDNPAARLHRVLSEIKRATPAALIGDVLRDSLGVEAAESLATLHHCTAVMTAWPEEARGQVAGIPDINNDLHLTWFEHVNNALTFTGRWGDPVQNMQNHYNEVDLNALAFAADLLHRLTPEPVIAEEKLPDLIALVRELIDGVISDEGLPEEVQRLLIDRLREVEQALLYFRITGYSGVADAMDRLLGGIVREPQAQEQGKAWFTGLWSSIQLALSGTKQIADTGQSAAAAIEAGKGLLGG